MTQDQVRTPSMNLKAAFEAEHARREAERQAREAADLQRQAEDLARAEGLEAALGADREFLVSRGLRLERRRYTVTLDHSDYRIAAYFENGEVSVTSADKRNATTSAAPRKQQFAASVEDALLIMAQFLADETR